MRPGVYMVLVGQGFDPLGRALALVIYRDRSYEYVTHEDMGDLWPATARPYIPHDQLVEA